MGRAAQQRLHSQYRVASHLPTDGLCSSHSIVLLRLASKCEALKVRVLEESKPIGHRILQRCVNTIAGDVEAAVILRRQLRSRDRPQFCLQSIISEGMKEVKIQFANATD